MPGDAGTLAMGVASTYCIDYIEFMREVNIRGVDLNLLVLLDLLIDHRSVTLAARAANMSQPAMSRALGRLRALLRDPVLARGSEGLVPTPAALALQPCPQN